VVLLIICAFCAFSWLNRFGFGDELAGQLAQESLLRNANAGPNLPRLLQGMGVLHPGDEEGLQRLFSAGADIGKGGGDGHVHAPVLVMAPGQREDEAGGSPGEGLRVLTAHPRVGP